MMCKKIVISQMPGEKSLASFRLCNTRVDVEFSYWLVTCNCLTKIYTDDFFGSSRFLSKEMASLFVFGRSALFFALIITQSVMLAAYPVTYKEHSSWYAVAASQALSVIFWLGLVLFSGVELQRLFYIWGLYILGLVISIAIVFVCVGDLLDKRRFLGPSVLKAVLCITPLLLLFLLNTAKDGENIKKWCPSCVFTRL